MYSPTSHLVSRPTNPGTPLATRESTMKERTVEDVIEDLVPIYRGDVEMAMAYKQLYDRHVKHKRVYVEPARSKLFGTLKYMVTAFPDNTVTILDLDTNIIYAAK